MNAKEKRQSVSIFGGKQDIYIAVMEQQERLGGGDETVTTRKCTPYL
jgi:hypothetical protein